MFKLKTKLAAPLSALALVAFTACDDPASNADMPNYLDGSVELNATVSGFSWDPEAFFFTLATCPPAGPPAMGNCQLPPLLVPETPIFEVAKMPNVQVGLFDPAQPQQTQPLPFLASAMTDPLNAGYVVDGVPVRPNPPFFTVAFRFPPMGGAPDGGTGPTNPLDHVPPASMYLPTLTARPISTDNQTNCLVIEAPIMSDAGIVEAVSNFMDLPAAGALLDPAVSGGVLVNWLYIQGAPILRVPAFGAYTQVSAGTQYEIWWAPPGALPPFLKQSRRGFFVHSSGPGPFTPAPTNQMGPIGVTVTVLPPLQGPPSPVSVTFVDPVTDEAQGRPFLWPALPPITVPPGLITYQGFVGINRLAPAAPGWVCLPH